MGRAGPEEADTDAAIYTRISSDAEGRELGVDRQEHDCRALAERHGWTVGQNAVYQDNDISAASGKRRPRWEDLLKDLEDGRVQAVVAYSSSRMYRRPADLQRLLDIVEKRRAPIETVASGRIDLTTADGRMLAGILAQIDQGEVERASERQRARWAQRKRDGQEVNLGRRPFGFDRVGNENAKHLVVNRREAAEVKKAARSLIAGASLYRVTASMTLPPPYAKAWRPQHLKRMFSRDLFVRHGILTADQDTLIKARLAAAPRRGRGRPPRQYLLSGLVRCGLCGEALGAGSGAYRCQTTGCGRVGVLTRLADEVVIEELQRRAPAEVPVATNDEIPRDDAPIVAELRSVEERIAALADDVSFSEIVLARRLRALEARRGELIEMLGRPTTTSRFGWLRQWVADGCPEPDPTEFRDDARELIASVTIQPTARRGSKIFDPGRVEVAWRS